MAIVRTRPAPGCVHAPGCPHDIGPAAGSVDGLAAIGRVSALDRADGLLVDRAQAMGSGPVERRSETPGERAAREVREAHAARTLPRDPDHRPSAGMHLVRPAARPAAPQPATVEEDPVTTPVVPPAIPCGDCLHADVCALRAKLPDNTEDVEVLAPGLRLRTVLSVECDHHLVDPRADHASNIPVRAEHGGESWRTVPVTSIEELDARVAAAPRAGRRAPDQESRQRGAEASRAVYARERATKDARAIGLLREHGGNAEAAGRAMGVSGAAVKQWVARMAEAGTLPGDVAELVAARGRKKGPA